MSLSNKMSRAAVQPAEQILREAMVSKAKEMGIKDIHDGDFIRLDGEPYQVLKTSPVQHFAQIEHDPQRYYAERASLTGTYSIHHSTIAFVDERGALHAGPATDANIDLLQNAGYSSHGGFWVPLSNGESLVRPEVADAWRDMFDRARKEWEQDRLQKFRDHCADKCTARGADPDVNTVLGRDGAHFLKADGIVYTAIGGELGVIPESRDPNRAFERPGQAGSYAANNGKLAFVAPDGALYIGQANEQNINALSLAGYEQADFHVPFSNGEVALSWSTLLEPDGKSLRALDPKLIGDVQEVLGRERDPQSVINWYSQSQARSAAADARPMMQGS